MEETQRWWQNTTIYQIYPRSYKDSNGDGIGDLRGILTKLDYIEDLGFETIWLSPFFCSPQKDFGYDVSDYRNIAAEYGTIADVEELITAIHKRGMRVLFDLVLNHTSDNHPWFLESRSSRDNPKRDWYIWRDGHGRHPPNNWVAIPGGSAWHFDEATGQYYYASFLSFQPDLNWRNPEVKKAMFDIVKFWLDKGVDGFRLDIFHTIYKDHLFRDNPFSFRLIPKEDRKGFFQRWKYSLKQPEVYKLAVQLRQLIDSYDNERMLIGEVFGSTAQEKRFLGKHLDGLNLIFLWELLKIKPRAKFLRDVIKHYEHHFAPPYTPVFVFGNHDRKRLISHINGNLDIAKLLVVYQFTTRGVPVTYYGEEIGMKDGNIPASSALDPIGRRYQLIPGFVLDLLDLYVNRDNCRTPMQWDNSPNGGFCDDNVQPWLPVNHGDRETNVNKQQQVNDSLLNTYRKVLRLRREEDALQSGDLIILEGPNINKALVVYERKTKESTLVVALNFSKKSVVYRHSMDIYEALLTIGGYEKKAKNILYLSPYSGVVVKT